MASGIRKFHEQGKFDLELTVATAEHVESMSEIPGFVTAVPTPTGIRVGVMATTVSAKSAGKAAGREMSAKRG